MQACAFKAGEFRPPVLSWVDNLFLSPVVPVPLWSFLLALKQGSKSGGLALRMVAGPYWPKLPQEGREANVGFLASGML